MAVIALVLAAGDVDPVDVAVAERSNSENLKCGDKSKSFIVEKEERIKQPKHINLVFRTQITRI